MDRTYFYAISRQDLPTHQQAIQAAHAQLEYCRVNGIPEGEHPNYVWLTVENKWDLLQLTSVLRSHGVIVTEFHDPDYPGYDPSSIACIICEDQRFLLSYLPLWKCRKPAKETVFYHLAQMFNLVSE